MRCRCASFLRAASVFPLAALLKILAVHPQLGPKIYAMPALLRRCLRDEHASADARIASALLALHAPPADAWWSGFEDDDWTPEMWDVPESVRCIEHIARRRRMAAAAAGAPKKYVCGLHQPTGRGSAQQERQRRRRAASRRAKRRKSGRIRAVQW